MVDVSEYLRRVSSSTREEHIRVALYELLKDMMGEYGEVMEIELEKPVRDRGLLVGRTDIQLGRVIVEVKRDIKSKSLRKQATQELEKYLSAERQALFGIITDGINFEVYHRDNIQESVETFSFPEDPQDHRTIQKVLNRLDRYLLFDSRVPLNSEGILRLAGYNSNLFMTSHELLSELFEKSKEQKDTQLKFSQWKLYMSYIYGQRVEEDLFIRHTYLSLLVKVLACRLLGFGGEVGLVEVLSGEYFRRVGVQNYAERDFYSWVLQEGVFERVLELAENAILLIEKKFDLLGLSEEVEEDLLKELYQNVVSREERQLTGEYYTPDWLCQMLVEEHMKDPHQRVLDPSCGSGSFLFFAIRKKKELLRAKGLSEEEILAEILQSVVGFDINPIACFIAKTNYLVALGELLRARRTQEIYLPVYTTDSLQSMLTYSSDIYGGYLQVHINGKTMPVPFEKDPALLDRYVDAITDYALGEEEDFERFLRRHYPDLEPAYKRLHQPAKELRQMVKKSGDSIWGFVLKNIYKPVFLRNSFDLLLGNPPWITYNRMSTSQQKYVEGFIKGIGLAGHLKTSFELATLFFVKCAESFLEDCGVIAFVLPNSVINGDQNRWFREKLLREYTLLEVYDLKDVFPLFNQASCVVCAEKKKPEKTPHRLPARRLGGRLPHRNAELITARKKLTEEKTELLVLDGYWSYEEEAGRATEGYAELFRQGATIVPRSFWFVEIEPSPLGYTLDAVPVRSKRTGDEKLPVELKGYVPERYFFKTILSRRLYPFGFVDFDQVVLPLEVEENRYRLLDYYEKTSGKKFRSAGERFWWWIENSEKLHRNLKDWLSKAQREWERLRGEKAKEQNVLDWLEYRRKLTSQPVSGGYLVLYTTSGTYPCACVVEKDEKLVADTKTYYGLFVSFEEAIFVCALLNSPHVHEGIRQFQSRGLFGERDIHKLPLRQNLPVFDPGNHMHMRVVERAKFAYQKAMSPEVRRWLSQAHPNRIRSLGRFVLEFDLNAIDGLLAQIMDRPEPELAVGFALFADSEDTKTIKKLLKKVMEEEGIQMQMQEYPPQLVLKRYNPLDELSDLIETIKSAIELTADVADTASLMVLTAKFARKALRALSSRGIRGIFVRRKGDQKEVIAEDEV